MTDQDTLESHAVRLYRRYAVEVVERFNLCPWAERARCEGKTREHVFQQKNSDDLTPSLLAFTELEGMPHIDIGLFIYPLLSLDLPAFEGFARRLGRAYGDEHHPARPPFVMAAFHPDPPAHTRSEAAAKVDPERSIPHVRRTPDPTLQIVRYAVLEQVRQGRPREGTQFFDLRLLGPNPLGQGGRQEPVVTLRKKIAQQNLETLEAGGAEAFEAAIQAIHRDRDATYSRWR